MKKTILCVDDSATMQKVAEITFRASEYDLVGARSGDEALAAAKKTKPTLVLLDSGMPDTSGYDLCRQLRDDADLADVPIVLMCGVSQPYDDGRGSDAGAVGHVKKPWDTEALLKEVESFIAGGAKAGAGKAADAPKAAASAPRPSTPSIPSIPAAADGPPRSPTLMGMPSLQMPPGGGRSAAPGVTPITPPSQARKSTDSPAPRAGSVAPTSRAASEGAAGAGANRAPMIQNRPSKPIRLVLASQAEQLAIATGRGAGLDGAQAEALAGISRDVLERIVWEVVPELAEAIIRENLDTLAGKAR